MSALAVHPDTATLLTWLWCLVALYCGFSAFVWLWEEGELEWEAEQRRRRRTRLEEQISGLTAAFARAVRDMTPAFEKATRALSDLGAAARKSGPLLAPPSRPYTDVSMTLAEIVDEPDE